MTSSGDRPEQLLPVVREIADEAGRIAMRYFHRGRKTSARIWSKAGGSPVTEADVAVDTFLKIRLSEVLPKAAWLSEETADDPRRIGHEQVWIVDPIDGTRAFLSGSDDWSIAIGLLVMGTPVLGVVYAPSHAAYYEAATGRGARRNGAPITVSARPSLASASASGPAPFVDRLVRRHPEVTRAPRVPSLALRIARVAEGTIDLGLISGHARDWDIAAADVILREAGGVLCDPQGRQPTYNRPDPVHGELLASPKELQAPLIDAIRAS